VGEVEASRKMMEEVPQVNEELQKTNEELRKAMHR